MTPELQRELLDLLQSNRDRALWSWSRDAVPQTPAAARRMLQRIATRGDRATFIRAHQLLRRLP